MFINHNVHQIALAENSAELVEKWLTMLNTLFHKLFIRKYQDAYLNIWYLNTAMKTHTLPL